jgi:hypothetical protein
MTDFHSNALVFFGVTGDLAYKVFKVTADVSLPHGGFSL